MASMTKLQLKQVENYADKLFAKLKIDVEFTRHFFDRVNDARNGKQITPQELAKLFKKSFEKYGKKLSKLNPGAEAVLKDMASDINMPFVIKWDGANKEMDLVAKTVMRKRKFSTKDKQYRVEGKTFSQFINEL